MDGSFLVFVAFWGGLATIFYFLDKRAKNISQRKRLGRISGALVFLLMAGFLAMQEGEQVTTAMIMLAVGAPIFIFIGEKFTHYCEDCGKCVQMPGRNVNFCPKCGGKLVN